MTSSEAEGEEGGDEDFEEEDSIWEILFSRAPTCSKQEESTKR